MRARGLKLVTLVFRNPSSSLASHLGALIETRQPGSRNLNLFFASPVGASFSVPGTLVQPPHPWLAQESKLVPPFPGALVHPRVPCGCFQLQYIHQMKFCQMATPAGA
jgi:hypothetical protein